MARTCRCGLTVTGRRPVLEHATGRVTRAGRMGGVDLPNLSLLVARRPELVGIGVTPLLEGVAA